MPGWRCLAVRGTLKLVVGPSSSRVGIVEPLVESLRAERTEGLQVVWGGPVPVEVSGVLGLATGRAGLSAGGLHRMAHKGRRP